MRVTLIVIDNRVYVDGVSHGVDLSPLAGTGLTAVQWSDNAGHEEYKTGPNQTITSIAPYQPYLDAWKVEDDKTKQATLQRAQEEAERKRGNERAQARSIASQRIPITIQQELISKRVAAFEKQKQEDWDKLSPEARQQLLTDAGF